MHLQISNSPFNEEQTKLLNNLLSTLSEEQKIWLSGFLAASQHSVLEPNLNAAAVQQVESAHKGHETNWISNKVTILYASQTGNCQMLAKDTKQRLMTAGFEVALLSMEQFKPRELKKINHLLIITSTHGEGDPPDNALSFHEFVHSRKAPDLSKTKFSVLALGDTSYEFFCKTGKDFDKRLEQLGGKRLYKRVDCDVDFEETAEEWISGVISSLQSLSSIEESAAGLAPASKNDNGSQTAYGRMNPFYAEVLENLNLNGRGSNKETRHIELDLEGSGLAFEPGDSLGIFPENEPSLVDRILDEMSWDPKELVTVNKQGKQMKLRSALILHYEITVITIPLLEKAKTFSDNKEMKELVKDKDALKEYIEGKDLLDVCRDFAPWNVPADEFVSILRKIPPRLYSIANSQKANPDEVHLTIGTVRYESNDRLRTGVCSGQCAERTNLGDTLPVFIQSNPNFKLPENPDTPIIMIGPGTGVAPFRAFLEEREEEESTGKSWLFFGDQYFQTDFLYQTDWQRWLKEGILTKIDLAFSRDMDKKVYVQDRMLERSNELYNWIAEGAVIYVCGDEENMAGDVHDTLHYILQKEGGMSIEDAKSYLEDMRRQKRYQRDVY